jgi:flagellar secretion chaperone FliS
MNHSAHETYWATQVGTATPQKLRLMLIEGALKFARQALECWDDEQLRPLRCSALDRCNDILTELHSSIRVDQWPLAARVKDIYRFLLVQLADITTHHDPVLLHDLLDVLESERETWRQLCEKMPEPPLRDGSSTASKRDLTADGLGVIAPNHTATAPRSGLPGTGLCLEA